MIQNTKFGTTEQSETHASHVNAGSVCGADNLPKTSTARRPNAIATSNIDRSEQIQRIMICPSSRRASLAMELGRPL
jgi:hypothetical protein